MSSNDDKGWKANFARPAAAGRKPGAVSVSGPAVAPVAAASRNSTRKGNRKLGGGVAARKRKGILNMSANKPQREEEESSDALDPMSKSTNVAVGRSRAEDELSRLDERIDVKMRGEAANSVVRQTSSDKDDTPEGAVVAAAVSAGGGVAAAATTDAASDRRHTVSAHGMSNEPDVEFGMTEEIPSHGTDTAPTVDYGGREIPIVPIATAVPEGQNDGQMDDQPVYRADPYDPDAKPPMVRNRRFRFYGACIVFLAVAISVAIAVGLTVGTDGGGGNVVEPTISPTPRPTPSPTSEYEGEVMGLLSEVLGPDRSYLLYEKESPQYKAKEWIVQQDLDIDEKLAQTFTLVSLYYSTTKEGAEWNFCGEPEEGGDDDYDCQCIDRNSHTKTEKRWLAPASSASICEWCGVYCDGNGFVGVLDLVNNSLTGPIPPEISVLSNLNNLLLFDNKLTGTIPSTLGSMTSLKDIQLQVNHLVGEIPEELYNAKILQVLTLSDNFLNGTISTLIGRLTSLKGFHTSRNMMSGEIPTEIGKLKHLLYSWHWRNLYSGTLPTELGELTKLKELMLVGMNLNGTIPSEMGKLTNMEVLLLDDNNFQGQIPDEIYNLKDIRDLWFHRNQFTGTISKKISRLEKVQKLAFSQNKLTGPIPTELGQLTMLTHLWLYWNNFNTSIPNEVCETKENRKDNQILSNLQADCETTEFESIYGKCRCCTACCDTTDPGGDNCYACNDGAFCIGYA